MDQSSPEGKPSTKRYKGQGRVAFLANFEKIQNLVEAGWPLQAVFDQCQDGLGIQYIQFRRYVRQYIPVKEHRPVLKEKPREEQNKTSTTGYVRPTGFKQFVPGPKNPDPKDIW